jgi:DinB superfamily
VEQRLDASIALLERTPAALSALLRGLPDTWTLRNEGEGTWSAFEILAHLIHAEKADWIPRVRMILEVGDKEAFKPFDRTGYDPKGKPLSELLDEFARLRAERLNQLRGMDLSESDMQRRGRHPLFGEVRLSQLLATWVTHDLTHIHQLSRVLAHQYREAVGPWMAFLGVLKCTGHSESG